MIVKVLEILVSLVYVVYDATTKDPPRVGHDGARTRDMLCGGHSHLSRMSHSLVYKYGGLQERVVSSQQDKQEHVVSSQQDKQATTDVVVTGVWAGPRVPQRPPPTQGYAMDPFAMGPAGQPIVRF